ncbi:MAG: transposase, partial [Dehalococcoidales bacterium]|nr:transposase [Dehalococcoidales bacterium]
IDSTHIVADMAVTSLTGLVKLCRHNVLKTIEKQDAGLAEKLGLKDMRFTKKDKFTRMEDDLAEEIKKAENLLDNVTQSLKDKKLIVTPELQKDLGLLEKAEADRDDKAKDRLVSPVDPDARAGKKQHKHWVGYKSHMIVEEDSEIITAVETTPGNKADGSQLKSLLDQQKTAFSLTPEEISGDKGYGTLDNLQLLASQQITGYISLTEKFNRKGPDLFNQDDFRYDSAEDTVTCPAGCTVHSSRRDLVMTESVCRYGIVFQFSITQCRSCEFRPLCQTNLADTHGRAIYISSNYPYYQEMKARMASEEGKDAYRNRYKVEHKIADLARWCGMRRCRYRGLVKAKTHTLLSAIASNVKRMARLICPRTGKICPLLELASQSTPVGL